MGKVRHRYSIWLKAEGPVSPAGLWDHCEGEGLKIDFFAIVVTDANDLTKEVHDRMPVILDEADWKHWLDPGTPHHDLKGMLVP